MKIPKLQGELLETNIHIAVIALEGEQRWKDSAAAPDPPFQLAWHENCLQQHAGWQAMFWDMQLATKLLEEHYPWFLTVFLSYKRRVQQGASQKVWGEEME